MTLQSNQNTSGLRQLILTLMLLTTAAVGASAQQTNTFPSTGNAGVGTTSPVTDLEVKNSSSHVGITANSAAGSTDASILFQRGGVNQWFLQSRNSSAPTDSFVIYDAVNFTHPFVLTRSGNVGIGTTSPAANGNGGSLGSILQIQGSTGTYGLVNFATTATALGTVTGGMSFVTTGTAGADKRSALILSQLSAASGTNVSGNLQFFTNNAGAIGERMRIDAVGNVGIGTTNPLAQLHVGTGLNAGLKTYTSSATDHGFLFNSYIDTNSPYRRYGDIVAISNQDGISGGSTIRFLTNPHNSFTALERMRIDYLGNVGIGLTNPTDRLSVYKGDNNAYLRIGAPFVYQSAIAFSDDTNGQDSVIYRPGSTRDLAFYTTTASNVMYLTQGGTVGIATSSPNSQYKLDVNGEINATGIRINGTPISSGSQWSGTSGNPIYYNVGNVGIGTTTPGNKLEVVEANPATASSIRVLSGSASAYGGYAIGRTATEGYWGVAGSAGHYSSGSAAGDVVLRAESNLLLANSGNSTVYLKSNGNVGISNTSPTEKLHVTGNGKFTGNLTVDGTINAKYQDLAEWVPSSEELSAGTVVVLDTTKSNEVISSTASYDTRVAGVISAQPGITLGEGGEGKVLVATTGRVRVKVDASRGAIQIGDLLVTSDVAGVAMKSEPVELAGRKMHMPGTIIGKALEPLAKGSGEILVLLSLQ